MLSLLYGEVKVKVESKLKLHNQSDRWTQTMRKDLNAWPTGRRWYQSRNNVTFSRHDNLLLILISTNRNKKKPLLSSNLGYLNSTTL